jgi:hypothetical protein
MAKKEGYNNFSKLQLCLTEATKLFRSIFKSFEEHFNIPWNDTKDDALFFTNNNIGKEIKKQLHGDQFKLNLERGNSKDWDFTILSRILTSDPFQDANKKPHIERIREIRNKLAHLPDINISDKIFNELFEIFNASIKSLQCDDSVLNYLNNEINYKSHGNSKKNFDENQEYKNLILLAEKEYSNKNYITAVEAYSKAINFYDHTNDELGDLYHRRSIANLHIYDA